MAYDVTRQIAALLGDVRGLVWSPLRIDATRARVQRQLAQAHYAIQRRGMLLCTVGQRFVALPEDHIQTFALTRGTYTVSARFLDAASGAWWLTVSPAGVPVFSPTLPSGTALLATTQRAWLRLLSPDGTAWYVSPSTLGDLLLSTDQPAGAGETRALQLRDSTGTPWYLRVDNAGILQVTSSGTAALAAPGVTVTPLQRLDADARQRSDPRQATGPPRYYAIEGKLLLLDPTPDATYELEHLYYTSTVTDIDPFWQTVSVLGAVAQLLPAHPPRRQVAHLLAANIALAAGHQLQAMAQAEAALLEQMYVPGTYDSPRDARAIVAGIAR